MKPSSARYQSLAETQQKERKLQANIPDKHRCKNPQQNISKPNPTAQQNQSYSSRFYPWDARLVQRTQINECFSSHKQN